MDMQVATKLYLIELQKKQIEKAQKVFKYSHNELRTFICDFGFCCSFSKNDIYELLGADHRRRGDSHAKKRNDSKSPVDAFL